MVRPVDPIAIIDGLELTADERGMARRALLGRRMELMEAATGRAEVQVGLGATMDALTDAEFATQHVAQQVSQRPDATDEERKAARAAANEARQRRDRESVERSGRQLAADRVIRAAFTEAIAGLSEANQQQANERYERRAVPGFFADPRAPWPLIDRALAVDDLDAGQRDAIVAVRDEAERTSIALAVAFGDLRRAAPDPAGPIWQDVARLARQAALVFDRDENSARAVSRLRRSLTPQQQALVRGLDDYERRVERVSERFLRSLD